MSYQLHPKVADDLFEIWSYIADDDPEAAHRVEFSIRKAFERIGDQPDIGHIRPELAADPIRFWTARPYIVAYDSVRRPPLILMAFHGARNPRTLRRLLRGRR